jgi:hypothetical protein
MRQLRAILVFGLVFWEGSLVSVVSVVSSFPSFPRFRRFLVSVVFSFPSFPSFPRFRRFRRFLVSSFPRFRRFLVSVVSSFPSFPSFPTPVPSFPSFLRRRLFVSPSSSSLSWCKNTCIPVSTTFCISIAFWFWVFQLISYSSTPCNPTVPHTVLFFKLSLRLS